MISAQVVEHTYGYVATEGKRSFVSDSEKIELITFECVVPKWMVAEINTDRMKGRNSASSRAIPMRRVISMVEKDWYEPQEWRYANEAGGMQAGQPMTAEDGERARQIWLAARDSMLEYARQLANLGPTVADKPIGTAKEHGNRLLEPFMWTTVVITGTEWTNFFALRTAPGAQPEFQTLANEMTNAREKSKPRKLQAGYSTADSWHLPYVTPFERANYRIGILPKISARRIAAVSYYRQGEDIGLEREIARCDELIRNKHWSPLEGPSRFMGTLEFYGPYRGFKAYRKHFKGESGSLTHGAQENDLDWAR